MKLREKRKQQNRKAKELAECVGTDEPMFSKFENYKCLPIPTMLKAICKELNCEIKDIYENDELYITNNENKIVASEKEKSESEYYNLTVRLPKDARKYLNKEYLRKCGYKDITYWIWRCYERLQKQYEIINKAEQEKRPADAVTSDTVNG